MAVTEVLIPRRVEEEFPGKTEASAPDVRVVPFDEDGPAGEVGSPRAMLLGGAGTETIRRLLDEYPSIEWVHSFAAGVESLLPEMQGFDVTITNSAGVHGEPIAEWVITMLLAHTKRLPLLLSRQADREWKSELVEEIGGKTLGIVGAGGIGSAITRRAVGLDMQLVGSRSSGEPTAHIARMYTPDRLHEMLGECDYVVIALPLTGKTSGLFGEAELRAMKPTAVLLNIARGSIIQTDALLLALTEGWIAGACLDVTDPEPLPSDHPLWAAPNTIITAHTSGNSPRSSERTMTFYCDNLRRFVAGEELLNVVDREREY